ncbi:cytochrome P450 [Coniochaeta sp. 2T2.1]|nr:cytochrome P450 [Coniochaeta sp. 2T2.1]
MRLSSLKDLPVSGLVVTGVILSWLIYHAVQYVQFHMRYRFPPREPGVPLFGNLFGLMRTDTWRYLKDLSIKHGEMFTLKVGSKYWVVLNSTRVANELLDKRGAIYISRQDMPMGADIMSGGKKLLFMPNNDLFRLERKISHEVLGPSQRKIFAPQQDLESKALLFDYLSQPDKWWLAHARYSSSVIMNVLFGRRTKLGDENVTRILNMGEKVFEVIQPGSNIVDAFPWLATVPLPRWMQPWRWEGDKIYEKTLANYAEEFEGLEERTRNGTTIPCAVSEIIRLNKYKQLDRDSLYFLGGTLLEAGSDTTRVSLNQIVAAAALFPDWVKRVQQQLDEVCGANAERLPTADDAPVLPLVKAAAKESIRWNPALPEIGHTLTRDDTFEGYHFPAGTTVTWNHWAICTDPKEYEQPERFWPERFLNDDLDKPFKGLLGFGAGRRLCPGWFVGSQSLFLTISRLLYCFDILPVEGKPIPAGKPFTLSMEGPPFAIEIRLRSSAHEELIRRECTSAALQ